MWKLKRENLSHLGGRMGTEYTTTDWVKIFSTEEKALAFMEKDLGEPVGKPYTNYDNRRSWDFGGHGYILEPTEVDEE